MTQISVLFLTKNRSKVVRKCLTSLEYLLIDKRIKEWIILDNASEDNLPKWLKRRYIRNPKVKLYFSDTNLGVAGGRDKLTSVAQGDMFWILDSDVEDCNQSILNHLLPVLKTPDIGIVGLHGVNVMEDWTWVKGTLGYADGVSGYCQLFSRNLYDSGCRLDHAYNPYWLEDTDFCMQAKYKLGLHSYVHSIPPNVIQHKWGKTCAGGKEEQEKRWKYFVSKWENIHTFKENTQD